MRCRLKIFNLMRSRECGCTFSFGDIVGVAYPWSIAGCHYILRGLGGDLMKKDESYVLFIVRKWWMIEGRELQVWGWLHNEMLDRDHVIINLRYSSNWKVTG